MNQPSEETHSRLAGRHARMVIQTLEALDATGARWAVLTGEPALAGGVVTSDIDVVVDRPARAAARAVASHLPERLLPVSLWPYDVGAASLFVVPPDGGARVQLDLAHDPEGRGQYGFRTDRLLEDAAAGVRWPAVSDVDSYLYEVRKRIVKGQTDRLAQLLARAETFGTHSLQVRAHEIFSPRASRSVIHALGAGPAGPLPSPGRSAIHRLRTARRYVGRVRRPVGFWVHIEGPVDWDPSPLRPVLEPLLPHVRFSGPAARRWGAPRWWARHVAPVRWRPGLIVSWGSKAVWPRPDMVIPVAASPVDLAGMIIRGMEERLRRQFDNVARRAHPTTSAPESDREPPA